MKKAAFVSSSSSFVCRAGLKKPSLKALLMLCASNRRGMGAASALYARVPLLTRLKIRAAKGAAKPAEAAIAACAGVIPITP